MPCSINCQRHLKCLSPGAGATFPENSIIENSIIEKEIKVAPSLRLAPLTQDSPCLAFCARQDGIPIVADWGFRGLLEERPLQGRVTMLLRSGAALKAPLFHRGQRHPRAPLMESTFPTSRKERGKGGAPGC